MPVHRSENLHAKQQGKQRRDAARDGDRQIKPANLFEPFCFHIFTLHHKVKDRKGSIVFKRFYFGLFCRTICSNRAMYSAKAFRPAAVREQVVSGRLF